MGFFFLLFGLFFFFYFHIEVKTRKNIQLPVAVFPSKFSHSEKKSYIPLRRRKKVAVSFVGQRGERGVEVG